MARIKKWVILGTFTATAWLYGQLMTPNNAEAATCCGNGICCCNDDGSSYCC